MPIRVGDKQSGWPSAAECGRRPKITTRETGRVTSMKKIVTTTVTLAVLAISISSAQAAINITEATIQNGSVSISGSQAPRNAAIWWEGKATPSTSKNSGAFHLDTTNLPVDCVGRLQIGTEQRDVVINNCTPRGSGPEDRADNLLR